MSLEQKSQILDRILSLKDYSPFILICDSLAQTADLLINEMMRRKKKEREVVILESLNAVNNVAQHIHQAIKPGVSVVGVYHTDTELQPPNNHKSYAPQGLPLLEYMATSIVRVLPSREAQQRLADDPDFGLFDFSGAIYNREVFSVDVEHRRKTGRSLVGRFIIDSKLHTIGFVSPQASNAEDSLPENLTTFNLSLNERQKREKEKVQLPYMDAQNDPQGGGAIIYEFEKDDDYDEEDPYEDPF